MEHTTFEPGEKVVRKDGNRFFRGDKVQTVGRVSRPEDGGRAIVWLEESKVWHYAEELFKANEVIKSIIDGVSPDQPVVYNEKGGGQSKSPYRMDLVDPKSILEIASVLKQGAEKYGDDNWKLISTQDHLNHLLVHVYAHLAGDESDKHLAHAACRAIFALGVELEDK